MKFKAVSTSVQLGLNIIKLNEHSKTKQVIQKIINMAMFLYTTEMGHLAEIIEEGSGPSKKLQLYRFLIESFLPELVKVDPSDLLPHLECLTDEDKEEIMNFQTQHTSAMAALKLILRLGLHGEEWLNQLIHALRKTRYRRLASAIAEAAGICKMDFLKRSSNIVGRDKKLFKDIHTTYITINI